MKNVYIDPLAQRELADAADYYDTLSNGLGDALLLELGRALRQLSNTPLSCPLSEARFVVARSLGSLIRFSTEQLSGTFK